MDSKDLYSVLGVPRTAGQGTIQAAYRRLMRRYHPDAGLEADTARAQQINEAYQVLGDPKKRRQYDALSHSKITKKQPSSSAHAAKKTFKRKHVPVSKQFFQRRAPSISKSAAEWWVIAFITALCAFLYFARR